MLCFNIITYTCCGCGLCHAPVLYIFLILYRIVLPKRTFLMYADNDEDCDQWIELLQSKLLVSIQVL